MDLCLAIALYRVFTQITSDNLTSFRAPRGNKLTIRASQSSGARAVGGSVIL